MWTVYERRREIDETSISPVSLMLVVTRQAEVVKQDLRRSKVKLICFVDTLMTPTSVNIKPALFFSLLEANPGVGAIHHADHT